MIRNIKIHNIFNIIKILKIMKPNKYTHYKNYKNIYLSVFYDFSKFDGSKKEIKVWQFLVVPPKKTLTLFKFSNWYCPQI